MIYGSSKFFITLVTDENVLSVSAGFEDRKHRDTPLSQLMMDVLPEFALTHEEYQQIKYSNAVQKLRASVAAFYEKDQSERGEPGEVLLHLLMRDFFGTVPVASKIYFTDSNNSNVKGFDIVQTKKVDGKFKIFVGESKFTKSFDSALQSLKNDIDTHLTNNFLRKEFLFVGRKISNTWEHANEFKEQIDGRRSLDQIKDDMVLVTFAVYECDVTKIFDSNSQEFIDAITKDIEDKLEKMAQSFSNSDVSIGVILLPIFSKSDLKNEFNKRLRAAKDI